MSDAVSSIPRTNLLGLIASWPRSRFWLLCADVYPALAAAALPWSTTLVSVFVAIWLIVVIPTLELKRFLISLKRPISLAPLALFALALIGLAWTDDTWAVRLQGMTPLVKFAVMPLFIYHFSRSRRGYWVFIAFLASCSVVMGLSWIVSIAPAWKISATEANGIPVRNYIDQSQEFALCVFALAPIVVSQLEKRRPYLVAAYAALAIAFLCNLTFVVVARVAILYLPVMALAFALRYLRRRHWIPVLAAGTIVVALSLAVSPYMHYRVQRTVHDYQLDQKTPEVATSNGERLFYWRTAAAAIAEAPLFGHGTGSTKKIFSAAADSKTGEWANMVRNPHNQTLYVAMQWGLFGVVVLFGFWYVHLMTFFNRRGFIAWIGLIVVVQNIVSSLVNSHLFDFHEGWLYVLGVGVAGGMLAASSGLQHEPT